MLPCLAKLLEHQIHNQVYSYLTSHHILPERQAGFRKGYSTRTCVIEFLHHIFSNIDEGRACGVLFLDLHKAFDTVDHSILLKKLKQLGFRNSSVSWFESYLTAQKQATKINNTISSEALVTHGVWLFTLYVNDLPASLGNCHISPFADDTAISVCDNDSTALQDKLNDNLSLVSNWYQCNKLSVNIDKTKTMEDPFTR